jgi:hypothetical protein
MILNVTQVLLHYSIESHLYNIVWTRLLLVQYVRLLCDEKMLQNSEKAMDEWRV